MMDDEKKVILGSNEGEKVIRAYLLGEPVDEQDMAAIEKQLLLDEEFGEELKAREDLLIDEYLDNALDEAGRRNFERVMEISPDLRGRLRVIKGLRFIAVKERSVQEHAPASSWFKSRRLPVFAYGVAGILIVMTGLLLWVILSKQSPAADTAQGLQQLRLAYSGQRISESRLTLDADYAPLIENRGPETLTPSKREELKKAEALLLKAAVDFPSDPDALHAVALFHIAENDLDEAIGELTKAKSLAPGNAAIYSDLGSVYFEKARRSEPGEAQKNLSLALDNLDRAVELDPALVQPLFNRALVLQRMGLHYKAVDAWKKYLEKDPSSRWAEEARKHLAEAQSANEKGALDPDVILSDFIAAARSSDRDRAWSIARETRELITGAMILPRLAQRVAGIDREQISADDEDARRALEFLGQIEYEQTSDRFASDLAAFILSKSQPERATLVNAAGEMEHGHQLIKAAAWNEALGRLEAAKANYISVGNIWEAEIAEYQVCYVLTQLRRIPESNQRLLALNQRSRESGYKWLAALSSGGMANNYSLRAEHAMAIDHGAAAFKGFEEISDTYWAQNAANQLTRQYSLVGNQKKAFSLIAQSAARSNSYYRSRRQTSRDLLTATESLYTFDLYRSARVFAEEQLHYAAEILKDSWLTHTARINLAIIHSAEKSFDEAFRQTDECFRIVAAFPDPSMRDREHLRTSLIVARLQRESGNCADAVPNYDRVIAAYEASKTLITLYEARKGRLLCYIEQGSHDQVTTAMLELKDFFEANRQLIKDEQDRQIYFDREHSVYDIAADYAYTHLRDSDKAFEFLERSRARTLLATVEKGAITEPIPLEEFRHSIPAGTQILYYGVLPERLLIWRFSAGEHEVIEVPISNRELTGQIREYTDILTARGDHKDLSARLYQTLVQPVRHRLEAADTVYIVGEKALLLLSFASLVSPDTGRYLVQEFPLAYAPSATLFSSLSALAARKDPRPANEVFAIGNPKFSRADNKDLADLPAAKAEAVAVAGGYGGKSVVDEAATRNAILTGLRTADIFHFAGHYVVDAKDELNSRLIAADGNITIRELQEQRQTTPRLAVISACNSGVEDYRRGEGMVGAARAFLALGVPVVVGSQWAVDSAPTADLMIRLHRYRKEEGLSTVAALRRSQVDLLTSPDPNQQKPFFWAGFIQVGGVASY